MLPEYPSDNQLAEDVEAIQQALWNERNSPEILFFLEESVKTLLEALDYQQRFIENHLATVIDSSTSLIKNYHELELERIKYLLRCYLEIRLEKIEHLAHFITSQGKSYIAQYLSEPEQLYLSRFLSILNGYYIETSLSSLPDPLQRYNKENLELKDPDFIVGPDYSQSVCCYILEDLGNIEIDPRIGLSLSLKKGEIYKIPYSSIRSSCNIFFKIPMLALLAGSKESHILPSAIGIFKEILKNASEKEKYSALQQFLIEISLFFLDVPYDPNTNRLQLLVEIFQTAISCFTGEPNIEASIDYCCRWVCDVIWILELDSASCTETMRPCLIELTGLLLNIGLLTAMNCMEVLDPEFLYDCGLIGSKAGFAKKQVRTNTAALYKQQRYNLLREDTEGFSALIMLLNNPTGNLEQGICILVGTFDLDPNRVLDIILDIWISRPLSRPILALISSMKSPHMANIIGFKLKKISAVDLRSFMIICSLLIRENIVSFTDMLRYCSHSPEFLSALSSGLFSVGLLERGLFVIFSESLHNLPLEVREYSAYWQAVDMFLHYHYLQIAGVSFPESHKRRPQYFDSEHYSLYSRPQLMKINNLKDDNWQSTIFSFFSPFKLCMDVSLLTKIMRIILLQNDTLNIPSRKKWNKFVIKFIWPLLNIKNLPCLHHILWQYLHDWPYEDRFLFYDQILKSDNVDNPLTSNIRIHARRLLKRLAKETVKNVGRALAKLTFQHSFQVATCLLENVCAYENMIDPIVDILRYWTPFALDTLVYQSLQLLLNANKDANIANLAPFLGSLYAKVSPTLSLEPYLNALVRILIMQDHNQNTVALAGLSSLIAKLAGVEILEDWTDSQISLKSASLVLYQSSFLHTSVYTSTHNKTTSEKLAAALNVGHNLELLCILLSQMHSRVLFPKLDIEEETGSPIFSKSSSDPLQVIQKADRLHQYLIQLTEFNQLFGTEFQNSGYRIPSFKQLFSIYGLRIADSYLLNYSFAKSLPNQNILMDSLLDDFSNIGVLSKSLYESFWNMSLPDIFYSEDLYLDQISNLKVQSQQEAALNIKKKYILDQALQQLEEAKAEHKDKFKRNIAKLSIECISWIPADISKKLFLQAFCQECLFPRAISSPVEAFYSAQFVLMLQSLCTPEMSILSLMDMLFSEAPGILSGTLTGNEAMCFGRFLSVLLSELNNWRRDIDIYNEKTLNKPGFRLISKKLLGNKPNPHASESGVLTEPVFSTNVSEAMEIRDDPAMSMTSDKNTMHNSSTLSHSDFQYALYKWHAKLHRFFFRNLFSCVDCDDTIQIHLIQRNVLYLLIRISESFPSIFELGENLCSWLVNRIEEESRSDMKILMRRCLQMLRAKQHEWIPAAIFCDRANDVADFLEKPKEKEIKEPEGDKMDVVSNEENDIVTLNDLPLPQKTKDQDNVSSINSDSYLTEKGVGKSHIENVNKKLREETQREQLRLKHEEGHADLGSKGSKEYRSSNNGQEKDSSNRNRSSQRNASAMILEDSLIEPDLKRPRLHKDIPSGMRSDQIEPKIKENSSREKEKASLHNTTGITHPPTKKIDVGHSSRTDDLSRQFPKLSVRQNVAYSDSKIESVRTLSTGSRHGDHDRNFFERQDNISFIPGHGDLRETPNNRHISSNFDNRTESFDHKFSKDHHYHSSSVPRDDRHLRQTESALPSRDHRSSVSRPRHSSRPSRK